MELCDALEFLKTEVSDQLVELDLWMREHPDQSQPHHHYTVGVLRSLHGSLETALVHFPVKG